jgi:hypothetical protein
MSMQRSGALVSVLAVASCADLAGLSLDGVCGNQIVEPGEDCDTHVGVGFECGAPASTSACRFLCSETGLGCPSGFSCGRDRLCRRPMGLFAEIGKLDTAGFDANVSFVDMDSDTRTDLVETSRVAINVRFGEASGLFGEELSMPIESTRRGQTIAELVGAGLPPQIVFATPLGLGVAQVTDRAFELPIYASGPAPADRPFVVVENGSMSSAEIVGFQSGPDGLELVGAFDRVLLASLGRNLGASVYASAGELDPSREGDEIAIASNSELRAMVLGRCATGRFCVLSTIEGVTTTRAPLFADIEGDGRVEILFSTTIVQVARRGEDGTFGRVEFDNRFQALVTGCPSSSGPPVLLATGDFDADPLADYVTSTGVFLGRDLIENEDPFEIGRCIQDANEAVVADLNGDGLSDLAFDEGESLTILIAAGGGAFNRVSLPQKSSPLYLRSGDFDGDLLPDVAFVNSGEIRIAFGRRDGVPTEAHSVAIAPRAIDTVLAGHFVSPQGRGPRFADRVSDLLFFSSTDTTVYAGTPTRRLTPPPAVELFLAEEALFPQQIFSGHLRAGRSGREDLFIVATDSPVERFRDPDPTTVSYWLASSKPLEGFDVERVSCPNCTGVFGFTCARTIHGDLDGDQTDELITIHFSDPSCPAELIGVFITRPELGSSTELPRPEQVGPATDVVLADLDRDPSRRRNDVVVTFTNPPGLAVYLNGSAPPISASGVLDALAIAAVQTDEDPEQELVLEELNSRALYDLEETHLVRRTELLPARPRALTSGRFRRLFVTDVDGDRIEDLVLSFGNQLVIMRQLAK